MTEPTSSETGRLEQMLESVNHFKPVTTRRSFMQKVVLAGGVAAVAAASLGKMANVFASSNPVLDFVNAAVGAERIGIAFYGNALGSGSPFSVAGDPASHTLLNSSYRGYGNGNKVVVVSQPLAGYTTMAVTTEQGPDGIAAPTQQPQLAGNIA
jgi:hypothetical protein